MAIKSWLYYYKTRVIVVFIKYNNECFLLYIYSGICCLVVAKYFEIHIIIIKLW